MIDKFKNFLKLIFALALIGILINAYLNSDQYKADMGRREFYKNIYEQNH